MKKLTIADIKATEILSKEERKMVIGGMEGSSEGGKGYTGQCSSPYQSTTWDASSKWECNQSGEYSCKKRFNTSWTCTSN